MAKPLSIGNRTELLLDDALIDTLYEAELRMNRPERREVVLRMDQPWEGIGSGAYVSVFGDGGKFRMYYRCMLHPFSDHDECQYACYAESGDGIHWDKPALQALRLDESGIVAASPADEAARFRHNNIVLAGRFAHNFSPFPDTSPGCPPTMKFKAVAGDHDNGLVGFVSADGIRWTAIREQPLVRDGTFDSQNVAFWDSARERYICYSRYFHPVTPGAGAFEGIRCIQSCESPDFLHWSAPRPNEYEADAPMEHFYTNAAIPCPGAEHILLSFPMRFIPDRHKVPEHAEPGVSDTLLMSSRDGVRWNRHFREAWLRPGMDRRNWTQRNGIVAHGILDTSVEEHSLYVNEHYEWEDACIRRLVLPRHRFASVHAGSREGGFATKPLLLSGSTLTLNFATSAAGSVEAQLEYEDGQPIAGFAFADCGRLYGDELDHSVVWAGEPSLAKLAGKAVRIRFKLKDADLYAFRIDR